MRPSENLTFHHNFAIERSFSKLNNIPTAPATHDAHHESYRTNPTNLTTNKTPKTSLWRVNHPQHINKVNVSSTDNNFNYNAKDMEETRKQVQ